MDHGSSLRTTSSSVAIERISVNVASSQPSELEKIHSNLGGVDAVISGLGNRQPFLGDRVGKVGTRNLISAMERANIGRLVMMSSMGVEDDYPPMEWRFEGKVMKYIFNTICRREYNDLTGAEKAIKSSKLNYLIVRPVGLGETVRPKGQYFIQKKKYDDVLGPNMAKMDCGCFILKEALEPTYEKKAVVIGTDPQENEEGFSQGKG